MESIPTGRMTGKREVTSDATNQRLRTNASHILAANDLPERMVLIAGWSRDDNPSKCARRCKKLSTRPVEKEMAHCAVSPNRSLWLGDDSRSIQSSSTASQSRYWCRDLHSGCNSVPISMGRRRLGRTQIVNVEMRSCRPLWADDRQIGSYAGLWDQLPVNRQSAWNLTVGNKPWA